MKKIALLFPLFLVLLFVSPASAEEPLNAEAVITKLESLKGKTEWKPNYQDVGAAPDFIDHQRNYVYEIKGKKAAGTGTVTNLAGSPSSSSGKVLILSPGSNPPKGYNVVLIADQADRGSLKPGDKITFIGMIGNVSNWHGVSIDVKGSFTKIN
ncbi:MAG: hypothetical protein FIA94_07450 [Nitrospirae bacterium]|nr:hypothetical protein [Nitrospirota bacterium]